MSLVTSDKTRESKSFVYFASDISADGVISISKICIKYVLQRTGV